MPRTSARHVVDLDAVRAHHHTAKETRTSVALWIAVADVPVLLAEIDRFRSLLALNRAEHADLLAAARATVAAARDGEADPLYYIRDELAARAADVRADNHPPARPKGGNHAPHRPSTAGRAARLHRPGGRRRTAHQPHQALRTPLHRPDRVRPHRTQPQDSRRRTPHLHRPTPQQHSARGDEMSKRKPNLRSSIYEGSDGRWHGWVTMGIKDDDSPDRRHRTGPTEAEVTEKVRKLEAKRDAGRVDKPGRTPTVEEWMTTYLDTIAVLTLAPRSYDDYWSKTRNWIIPHLGKHRLDRLQAQAHRQDARRDDRRQQEKHTRAQGVSRPLQGADDRRAPREGRPERLQLIEPPSPVETEIVPLTQQEARRILAAAARRGNGARWSVGLALGLRQGEALGLRWPYVDLDAGVIRVWWQLGRANWRHGCDDPHACGQRLHRTPCPRDCDRHKHRKGCAQDCDNVKHTCLTPCPRNCRKHAANCPKRHSGGITFREPKGKSKRIIPLPTELVQVLKAHRKAQIQ
jgi:integrase